MVPNYFRNIVCSLVVLLVCPASYGEQLPDLITRLQKLDGKDPIRGQVHIEDRTTSTEEKGSKQLEKADLLITADANALTLTVTGAISNSRVFRKFSLFGMSSTSRRDVELWIDADGYPVAASFKTKYKARMLLFKYTSEYAREQRYKRLGGRLVLVFEGKETDIESKAGDEKRTITTTVEVKKD